MCHYYIYRLLILLTLSISIIFLLSHFMPLSMKSLAERISKIEKGIDGLSSRLPVPEKPSRFTDNGDGTVTDKETNLVWMKQDDGKRRTWKEAKEYAEENMAKLPGEGWRLPTVKELISIVDYEKNSPAIDPVFTNTQSAYYWTSSPHAGYSVSAWSVSFGGGYVDWYGTNVEDYVRPVRHFTMQSL